MTSLALLDEANRRGLTIRTTSEDLLVRPAKRCPPEFAWALRQRKKHLIALLRNQFLIVQSSVLNETVYFAADDHAKAVLVKSGALPGSVYTRSELHELVKQHRCTPITADELVRIHALKRQFSARILKRRCATEQTKRTTRSRMKETQSEKEQ